MLLLDPETLIFLRHGMSIGQEVPKEYDTPAFRRIHHSHWPLTRTGREQARKAGAYINELYGLENIHQIYSSNYTRAWETLIYAGIDPEVEVKVDMMLGERSWGELDTYPAEQRRQVWADNLRFKQEDPLNWQPPNGESMRTLLVRLKENRMTMRYDFADGEGKVALVAGHQEVMWGARLIHERIEPWDYINWNPRDKPQYAIHNCQILIYARRNPFDSSDLRIRYGWKRSICPWDLSRSTNEWEEILRPKTRISDLTQVVEHHRNLFPRELLER